MLASKEAYSLYGLLSFSRRYWRKAMKRGTKTQARGCETINLLKQNACCIPIPPTKGHPHIRHDSQQASAHLSTILWQAACRFNAVMVRNPRKARSMSNKDLEEEVQFIADDPEEVVVVSVHDPVCNSMAVRNMFPLSPIYTRYH